MQVRRYAPGLIWMRHALSCIRLNIIRSGAEISGEQPGLLLIIRSILPILSVHGSGSNRRDIVRMRRSTEYEKKATECVEVTVEILIDLMACD